MLCQNEKRNQYRRIALIDNALQSHHISRSGGQQNIIGIFFQEDWKKW